MADNKLQQQIGDDITELLKSKYYNVDPEDLFGGCFRVTALIAATMEVKTASIAGYTLKSNNNETPEK